MSGYYGDFLASKTVRCRFNTVNSSGVPTSLTAGAVIVTKDGADVTPSGGVTLSTDVGTVVGRNHVVIDMSVDTTTFTAGSEYAVRLSGSSAVGGTSVVGITIGEWSVQNRSALMALPAIPANWITSAGIAAAALNAKGDWLPAAAYTAPATPAAITTAVLTTQMTEAYSANGVAPTLTQAILLCMQRLTEFGISGTALTVRKLDGATTAYGLTLDSASAPTNSHRTS